MLWEISQETSDRAELILPETPPDSQHSPAFSSDETRTIETALLLLAIFNHVRHPELVGKYVLALLQEATLLLVSRTAATAQWPRPQNVVICHRYSTMAAIFTGQSGNTFNWVKSNMVSANFWSVARSDPSPQG